MSENSPDQKDQGAPPTAVSPPHSESSPAAASRQHDIPAATAAASGHANTLPGTSAVPAVAALKVAQPSTFLQPLPRPRAGSRPMTPSLPLSAVDREQIEGLVSDFECHGHDRSMHGLPQGTWHISVLTVGHSAPFEPFLKFAPATMSCP